MYKYFTLIFTIVLINSDLLGQFGQAGERKMTEEELFQEKKYAKYIAEVTRKSTFDLDTKTKLAESYRVVGNSVEAEYWYGQVIQEMAEPSSNLLFYYAMALQANGKYGQAKEYYKQYKTKEKSEAVLLDYSTTKADPTTTVFNVEAINTDLIETSPAYYKDGFVYITNHESKGSQKGNKVDWWLNERFTDIAFTDSNFTHTTDYFESINSKFHEGAATFTRDGKRIFFSQSTKLAGSRKKHTLKLFIADWQNGRWQNIRVLDHQKKNANYYSPTVSANGDTLYFVSDLHQSSKGLDIFVCYFLNGTWTSPKNLGSPINTPKNEVTPYLHQDGTLYFSSDGHSGFGNLDIFKTKKNEGAWPIPENLGIPINSPQDDLGYIEKENRGYFASNREGGMGQDDIYGFIKTKKKIDVNPVELPSICVESRYSDILVPFAKVTIYEDNNGHLSTPLAIKETDKNGIFEYALEANTHYVFVSSKEGYKKTTHRYRTKEIVHTNKTLFCLPLDSLDCREITGRTIDIGTGQEIPNSKIIIIDCDGEKIEIESDENGYYEYCLVYDCDDYKIVLDDLEYEGIEIDIPSINSPPLKKALSVAVSGYLRREKSDILRPGTWDIGAVIPLRRVFYDFDKWNIRKDATESLDNLIYWMKRFPSMKIELSSHTDCRGSHAYNDALSQKRAESVVEYLVQHGIERHRLIPRGYGERKLLNGCITDEQCSEEDHQINRRTEFTILEWDKKHIKIQQQNNMPEYTDRKREKK